MFIYVGTGDGPIEEQTAKFGWNPTFQRGGWVVQSIWRPWERERGSHMLQAGKRELNTGTVLQSSLNRGNRILLKS